MICTHRAAICVLFLTFCLLFAAHPVWASPSGLDNIPTTDVVPEGVMVHQVYMNLSWNKYPQQFLGFKAGPLKDLEVGLDWKSDDDVHGHVTAQAKYAFDIVGKDRWRGVIGFANLSDNRAHAGEPFPYAATSVDLKLFRLHFGYSPQAHNEAFFAGVDRTFPVLGRNLQLKGDAIHINDRQDVLFSVGFLYELGLRDGGEEEDEEPGANGLAGALNAVFKNVILESWVSMPSTGERHVFTLKLNYVIKF